jgi:hypothetical protein
MFYLLSQVRPVGSNHMSASSLVLNTVQENPLSSLKAAASSQDEVLNASIGVEDVDNQAAIKELLH